MQSVWYWIELNKEVKMGDKLKTLKDIMFEIGDSSVGDFFIEHNIPVNIAADICAKIQLKQRYEAKKWIEFFQKQVATGEEFSCVSVVGFIENFFNLEDK